jgi:uncharacterized protein YqeY
MSFSSLGTVWSFCLAVIAETGATSMSDIGKIMPEVMKRSAGRADGKLAQSLVRDKLG